MSRVPRIRFKGFEEDWEQRKLVDIAERIVRKNEKLESTLPLTISAQYGLIDQNEFFDKRIASKDVRGYYLIKKGEFAYNKSTSVDAPLGAIKRLDKYKNGVLSTLYIIFKVIDDTSTSSDYLVAYYATDLWHRGIQSIAAEGARNHGLLNIAPNDFFETMLSIPLNISEQKKVGDFFISLDHLITLHQRKLQKLKIIKKSMLENLFPQNGEKTPKIRFSGFTKDWEQRKWIDVVDISKNMVDPRNGKYDNLPHISPGNIESFTGQLYDNVKCVKDENLISGKFKFSSGDIIYGKINPQLGKYLYATFSGLTSADAYVLNAKNNVTQKYLYTIIQTRNFFEYSVSVSMRSGMPKINRDELNAYFFFAPLTEEQLKIGNCILKYDHLITLHQSKLDKLQKIKKSMLESMFV